MNGLLWFLGVHPVPSGTSPWYQLWSGFIPALTVLSLVTLLVGAWRHVNCHQSRCWRIGKHKVSGTPWCTRHHTQARPEQTTDDLLRDMSASLSQLAAELRETRIAQPPAKVPASRSRRA